MTTKESEACSPNPGTSHGGRRGKLIIISGPSGSGKSTICERLLQSQPTRGRSAQSPQFRMSVSATTRKPRPGERHGVDYHFISEKEFVRRIERGDFIEHAEYCGNLYGTLRATVDDALNAGHFLLLEIDVQGALQLMDTGSSGLRREDCLFVFIMPPSDEVLKQRLEARATEDASAARARLEMAQNEMKMKDRYDLRVINDDLDSAVEEILRFITQRNCCPDAETSTNG